MPERNAHGDRADAHASRGQGALSALVLSRASARSAACYSRTPSSRSGPQRNEERKPIPLVRRANNLEKIVKAKVSDAEFTVNAEKPRKGAFVVTVQVALKGAKHDNDRDPDGPLGVQKGIDVEIHRSLWTPFGITLPSLLIDAKQ